MSTNSFQAASKNSLIKQPRISEKASQLQAKRQFVFVVGKDADKLSVKRALENLHEGVKVAKVNMIKMRAQAMRFGRTAGFSKSFKKAVVTLSKNSKLPE